jgi:site-specific DNA recombinase
MGQIAAAYARVSTDRQTEARTIEQQIELLTSYAQEHRLDLGDARIFRDDGFSGARLDRPALDRLRDAVARGTVDVVLITSPDRLARRYAYQVWLLEEFERAGCRVVFLERPPTGDPQDALVIQIRGAVAEYERTVIADRMRRGRLAALRAGKILPWSTPPFGYQLDPTHPRDPAGVRLDENAAALVRQIFGWYVDDGLTLYQVALRLTQQKIPTPRGQSLWNASSVRKILTNPSYQGTAYGNQKQMVPARRHFPLIGRDPKGEGGESCQLRPQEEWIGVPVPAIVSSELFGHVQERLARNQQWARRRTEGEYLLRRLVSCRRCGLAHRVTNKGRYIYYHCAGQDTLIARGRPEACHSRCVPTTRLDAIVWEDLCHLLADPDVLDEALGRAQEGWLSDDERLARQRDVHRRQADTTRQIQRLIDAYVAGALTLEELTNRRAKLNARQADQQREEHELAAALVQEQRLQDLAGKVEEFRATIARGLATASFAQRRALVELLIDRVVVDAPEVEIRYVIPLSGIARRNGVLRSRHRALEQGNQATDRCCRDLSQHAGGDSPRRGGPRRPARRVAGESPLLQRRLARQS